MQSSLGLQPRLLPHLGTGSRAAASSLNWLGASFSASSLLASRRMCEQCCSSSWALTAEPK
eukprot:CAMPEP_0202910504 /NCGR_PEP_ID=MMETSP1392-20130828/52222_1 /ASSEMBLY_ACC=CAM_ASM_000868 /TAXON_ID=225041 /ORGANISM="Chlamydomonas chlamydogama, Strain SAG 11-48b" /LENGTH=60 /DNA_ID=CAMNT_0049600637 /DNA_START=45 /DNA_END=224 /DNA_ORIENTATION=-